MTAAEFRVVAALDRLEHAEEEAARLQTAEARQEVHDAGMELERATDAAQSVAELEGQVR